MKIDKEIESKLKEAKIEERKAIEKVRTKRKTIMLIVLLVSLVLVLVFLFLNKTIAFSFLSFFVVVGLFYLYFYLRDRLKKAGIIKKMEDNFPDFLQLMASNLRAGMTVDRAMLLSARPEFDPLDKEILNVGKEIATGRSIEASLYEMSKRIGSEKIEKTIFLIISGLKSGGNLAILLEETSINMRERSFVEKKASSNVLMYAIFIFIAASVGAPVLFSLSSLLVETLTNVLSGLPPMEATTAMSMPFTLSRISVSIVFIKYFSLVFIITTNVLAALVLGLVNKGDEKEGVKYLIPMLAISIVIFFGLRFLLSGFITSFFG